MSKWQDRDWRLAMLCLLFLALLSFGAGIMLPMMTVKKLLLMQNQFSILAGIGQLLADKTFGLGILLLFFSVIFPVLKWALMLGYVCLYPPRGYLLQWQLWLGKAAKFSMLDVFVVAQMLMILKLGWVVEVEIHSGIYWFSAAVVLFLLAGILIERNMMSRCRDES